MNKQQTTLKTLQQMDESDFHPFSIGKIANPLLQNCPTVTKTAFKTVEISYPSRINAMALDPSLVTTACNRRFTPGELFFSIDIPLKIQVKSRHGNKIETTHPRRALIMHAVELIRVATGFYGGISIEIEGTELPHCGLGSSGRLIAATAVAVNHLLGKPIKQIHLLRYLAQNHGEELKNSNDLLIPVQCIGGSAAAGLITGGAQIITGESTPIATMNIPDKYSIVIGYPKNLIFDDAFEAMKAELANFNKFIKVGHDFSTNIAYRILHEALPAFINCDLHTIGDIIAWYRYELGSLEACAFSHPRLISYARSLLTLRNKGIADIIGPSSVGPGVYAITMNPDRCEEAFRSENLQVIVTGFWNETYKVLLER